MTDTDRMVVWLREAMDAAGADAEAATPGPWHVTEYVAGSDYGFDAGIGTAPGEADVVGHGYEGGGCERVQDARHIVRHQPVAALRRIAADRKMLDDILAEPHAVLTPGGSTQIYCDADSSPSEPCNCGRDARIQRQIRFLAEGWGWTKETGSASA